MNTKVHELMTSTVVSTQPHATVGHVRGILERNQISALPVVDTEGRPAGIISATDLAAELKTNSPISRIMTTKVYTVPKYDDVSTAARVMRNHHIHRVLVTHEQTVVGVLSSFDLLKLVEDHRFVAKNPPTPSKNASSKRS
ncbi:MAG: CBS domain-containing protein [bacterium]|nr:CBS domain-containing protein [bacterium]MCP5057928.1 CBS domain-containing protein [bacterium]